MERRHEAGKPYFANLEVLPSSSYHKVYRHYLNNRQIISIYLEFLKQISQFNFEPSTLQDLVLEQEQAEAAIRKTKEKTEEIMDFKVNLQAGIQQVHKGFDFV